MTLHGTGTKQIPTAVRSVDYVLITPASIDPVTLVEAKAHLRVEITNDDTLITNLITAATRYWEERTRKQVITATYELTLPDFPLADDIPIEIPKPPLLLVNSIKYFDNDGALITWDTAEFQVYTKSDYGLVVPEPDEVYPDTEDERLNAVTINFDAGFGPFTTDVPELVKSTIKLIISQFYENREFVTVAPGFAGEIGMPKGIEIFIDQFALRTFV